MPTAAEPRVQLTKEVVSLRRVVACCALSLALLGAAPASRAAGQAGYMTTFKNTYLPGDNTTPQLTLTMSHGSSLTYLNLDLESHSVTSTISGLFSTPALDQRQSARVAGVEKLAPGSYAFYCSIHPGTMHGTLVVT